MNSRRVLASGREFYITDHALERWQQRVKPWLTPEEALEDLSRVLALAGEERPRPEWAAWGADERADAWVAIGEDIAFPVIGSRLITCLTRGYPSDETERLINELQQKRRAAKNARGKREKHGKVARAARVQQRRRRAEAADG